MGCTGHGDKRLMEHACASSFVCEVNGAAVTLLASAVKSKHPDLSGVLGWACYRKTAKLVTCGRFELSSNNKIEIRNSMGQITTMQRASAVHASANVWLALSMVI